MSVPCIEVKPCVSAEWTKWIYDKSDRLQHSGCGETTCDTKCEMANDALDMIAGKKAIDLRYDVNNNGVVDTEDVDLLATGTPLSTSVPAPFSVGDRVKINDNYGNYRRLTSYTGTITVVLANGWYVVTFDTPSTFGYIDDQLGPEAITLL